MSDFKKKILNVVRKDLFHIEEELVNNLNPHYELVSKIAGHILFSGGKRLRPLLMLLSSRICGYNEDIQFKYSTMFEYLHAATLLHDDVIDGADLRRGKIVANHLWDSSTVLLTGDFLLARSVSIAASTGSCSIIKVVANIAERMSQGEVRQLEKKKNFSITEDQYLEIISDKTAIMFSGACRTGAILASADIYKVNALTSYGYNLGMAFQMADDLLDYTKNIGVGKHIGADLKEGKLTLPVIFAMLNASQVEKDRMCSIASTGDFSKSDFNWFISSLKKYGGIEYTNQQAIKYVEKAKKALSVFDNNNLIYTLSNIAEYALFRKD